MNLILMGPPGVGKGTQSRRLSRELGIPAVASGDMFREMRRESSQMANDVQRYMDSGEYVPDELTIKMVLKRLGKEDARHGFILDGFPRTVPQAEALDAAFAGDGRKIDWVVVLKAPTEVVLKRLEGRWICQKCGHVYNMETDPPHEGGSCDECGADLMQRTDENPDLHRHRLEVFYDLTRPVLAYYRKTGRLQEIDAEDTIDNINRRLRIIVGHSDAA